MRSKLRKGRRPLRVASLATILLVTAGGLVATMLPASATTTAPTLTAKLIRQGTQVTLHWKFDTDSKRQRDRTLQIQRSDGGAFADALTKVGAGRSGAITDPNPITGVTTYRARVTITVAPTGAAVTVTAPTEVTDWGPAVTVDPTELPTTTTTVKTSPPNGITLCPESVDGPVIAQANAYRKSKNLASVLPLAPADNLNTIADNRAIMLAQMGHYDEHLPARDMILAAGYSWWGEDIDTGIAVTGVVNDFIHSSVHEYWLSFPNFHHVGFGCATDARGVPWYSLAFAN